MGSGSSGADKMRFPKSPRWESPEYRAFVSLKPGCHCRMPGPSHAHHWSATGGGMGYKPGDETCVPLCYRCHIGGFHRTGNVPGLTPEQTRELFTRVQAELQAEWAERAKAPEDPLADPF